MLDDPLYGPGLALVTFAGPRPWRLARFRRYRLHRLSGFRNPAQNPVQIPVFAIFLPDLLTNSEIGAMNSLGSVAAPGLR